MRTHKRKVYIVLLIGFSRFSLDCETESSLECRPMNATMRGNEIIRLPDENRIPEMSVYRNWNNCSFYVSAGAIAHPDHSYFFCIS